jgi:hypothetical protein
LAGPPLASRPGDTLQKEISFRGPPCKRLTQIVKVTFLFLVNCVENHKKTEKCKTNFFGFVVKYPTTFVIPA